MLRYAGIGMLLSMLPMASMISMGAWRSFLNGPDHENSSRVIVAVAATVATGALYGLTYWSLFG